LKDKIVNRVSNSKLVTIDLEDLYPEGPRLALDISNWLLEGVVLHEKDFREHLSNNDWSQYKNAYVALHCSTDAIIPGWAYMLVSLQLSNVAKKVIVGSITDLETLIFSEIITHLDLSAYKDQSVIIKGCGNKPVPENAYVLLAQKLRLIAKSIMYGEACSSVPLYKKSK
jgi:uncharacterized protein DUF2480